MWSRSVQQVTWVPSEQAATCTLVSVRHFSTGVTVSTNRSCLRFALLSSRGIFSANNCPWLWYRQFHTMSGAQRGVHSRLWSLYWKGLPARIQVCSGSRGFLHEIFMVAEFTGFPGPGQIVHCAEMCAVDKCCGMLLLWQRCQGC